MKSLYLLPIALLLFCGCDKKDGPTYGVGEPNFAIILNDLSEQNLLPSPPEGTVGAPLKLEHEVKYEVNGILHTVEGEESFDDCLYVEKKELMEGKPLALRVLPYDFGRKLIKVAKETSDYKCQAKIYLKCTGIFKDKDEHIIEMNLEYCGDKRYEILQVVKGSVLVDGVAAEYLDYDLYQINLNIK